MIASVFILYSWIGLHFFMFDLISGSQSPTSLSCCPTQGDQGASLHATHPVEPAAASPPAPPRRRPTQPADSRPNRLEPLRGARALSLLCSCFTTYVRDAGPSLWEILLWFTVCITYFILYPLAYRYPVCADIHYKFLGWNL